MIWGGADLSRQVLVHAIAGDRSPEDVLEEVRRTLVSYGATLDAKPSDVRGIGEGAAS